jgi:hypothetical protein
LLNRPLQHPSDIRLRTGSEFLPNDGGTESVPLLCGQFLLGTLLQMGRLGLHEKLVDGVALLVGIKAQIAPKLG